jgi:hypothetical protein
VTVRQARLIVIPFMLFAFAARFADENWTRSLDWPDSAAAEIVSTLGGFFVCLILPYGVYWLTCRRALHHPATWRVEEGRFVAHASAMGVRFWPIFAGWAFGGIAVTGRRPGTHVATVFLTVAVVVLLLLVALLVADRPRLTLDAQGMTLLTPFGARAVRWDDVLPGHPAAAMDVVRRTPSHRLPAAGLDIDPAFLAHTISYYAAVPAARSRIGTEGGLRELEDARAAPAG